MDQTGPNAGRDVVPLLPGKDEARRLAMGGAMEAANAAERTRPSDIDRLKAANRDPRTRRGRPGSLGPQETAALVGEQVPARYDDPLAAYGYGEQRAIGVMDDRVATLESALERAGGEQAAREAPAATVAPNETETIDPRGRLP